MWANACSVFKYETLQRCQPPEVRCSLHSIFNTNLSAFTWVRCPLCVILVNSTEEQTSRLLLASVLQLILKSLLSFRSTKVTVRYGSKNAAGHRIRFQPAQWLFRNGYTAGTGVPYTGNTDGPLQKTGKVLWNGRLWYVLPLR